MPKIPKALSRGEELFAMQCMAYNLTPEREFVFAAPRKYRFDFAWPSLKIAAEIDGGVWSGGRHTRPAGFESDCRKYNLAADGEWLVYRFSTAMVESGEAIDVIRKALK